MLGTRDALLDRAAGEPDLVQVRNLRDLRVIAEGSQHIHIPGGDIVGENRLDRGGNDDLTILLPHSDPQ